MSASIETRPGREQYQALWNSLDEIAERIRALGQYAPGAYTTSAAQ